MVLKGRDHKGPDDIIGNFAIFFRELVEGRFDSKEKNNTKTLLKLIEFSCGYIGLYNKLINASRNP